MSTKVTQMKGNYDLTELENIAKKISKIKNELAQLNQRRTHLMYAAIARGIPKSKTAEAAQVSREWLHRTLKPFRDQPS